LVGVISESTAASGGIAVIRNEEDGRSLTLSQGQAIPYHPEWRIVSIERDAVGLETPNGLVKILFEGVRPHSVEDMRMANTSTDGETGEIVIRDVVSMPANQGDTTHVWPGLKVQDVLQELANLQKELTAN